MRAGLNGMSPVSLRHFSSQSIAGVAVWKGLEQVALPGGNKSLGAGFEASKDLSHFESALFAPCFEFEM